MFHVTKRRRCAGTRLALVLALCISVLLNGIGVFAAEDGAHTLTWMLDGEVFEEEEYQEGDTVTAPEAPEKEKFLFAGWKALPETMPAEDLTVTGAYRFAGVPVTDLENVYECELVVSEDLAVTMYLRIDDEGNFVFSRSTDFSDPEKGAGKVYKQTPAGELVSGEYPVDISWSPMADTLDPVLAIDADHMTFELYGAGDPGTDKGSGTLALEDGVYTMHYADGENTTTFTYEDGVITFTSKLWYGSASFNQEDEAGNFASYEAGLAETEDAETKTLETEENETETAEAEDQVRYYFVYYVVNGEPVVESDYVSEFEIGEDGRLIFLSPFWFGGAEPKFVEEGDDTVTYPEFLISKEEILKDIDKETIVNKSAASAENNGEASGDGESAGFRMGTYGGTYSTTAMGNALTYACTITFRGDGTYSYSVRFHVMGSSYSESESGTYKVSGSSVTLTAGNGTVMTGSVGKNTVTITRYASSFAFSPAAITFTYGVSPSPSAGPANTDQTDNTNNGDSQEPGGQSKPQPEPKPEKPPVVNEYGLAGGAYVVDVSWSPMAAMFSPVLNIDAENGTFNLYNQDAESESKGKGTITHSDGVFTLHYEDGKTTTFTFKDGELTFTSKLWYGAASFNNADADGNFVPFTAKTADAVTPEEKPEQPDGAYAVDISWSPMAQMVSPVLELCAKDMTFNLYNAKAPDQSKGSGSVTYENGVYTLHYENGNTTTFTYRDGVITFTSKLWYGNASFNNADADGNFVSYTGAGLEKPDEPGTAPAGPKAGVYGGTYTKTAMGSALTYYVNVELKADGTYSYKLNYSVPMGGNSQREETEEGTYTADASSIAFTSSDGKTSSAAYTAAGMQLTRILSAMGSSEETVTLEFGKTAQAPAVSNVMMAKAALRAVPEQEPETETAVKQEPAMTAKQEADVTAEAEAEAGTEAEAKPEAGTEAEPGTEEEVNQEAEAGTEAEPGTEEEVNQEAEAETEAEPGTEGEVKQEAEAEIKAEPGTEEEVKQEAEAETEAEPGREEDVNHKAEAETEAGEDVGTKAEIVFRLPAEDK